MSRMMNGEREGEGQGEREKTNDVEQLMVMMRRGVNVEQIREVI